MTRDLPNPWIPEQCFTLDEQRFFEAIEPNPLFIDNPSDEYLTAIELIPIVEILVAHR